MLRETDQMTNIWRQMVGDGAVSAKSCSCAMIPLRPTVQLDFMRAFSVGEKRGAKSGILLPCIAASCYRYATG